MIGIISYSRHRLRDIPRSGTLTFSLFPPFPFAAHGVFYFHKGLSQVFFYFCNMFRWRRSEHAPSGRVRCAACRGQPTAGLTTVRIRLRR
jgi:hypothetical protein